jgi:ABC-type sugar transport system permease subunit
MNNNSESSFMTILSAPIVFLGNISENRRWAYYLIFPSLFLVSLVVIYPVISGILLSFQEKQLIRSKPRCIYRLRTLC